MMKKDDPPKYPLKSLRHVRASLEIHNGATAKELQVLMGHSSVQITFESMAISSRIMRAREPRARTRSWSSFLDVANLWQETTRAPSKPLVSFVSKAHEVITQGRVGPDTVKRWLRRLRNEDEERAQS